MSAEKFSPCGQEGDHSIQASMKSGAHGHASLAAAQSDSVERSVSLWARRLRKTGPGPLHASGIGEVREVVGRIHMALATLGRQVAAVWWKNRDVGMHCEGLGVSVFLRLST